MSALRDRLRHHVSDRPCPLCRAALAPGRELDDGCATRTRQYLGEVPAVLAELDLALSRQTSMPANAGVARCASETCTHEADEPGCVAGVRLVLDVRASDARVALEHVFMGWARVWLEELPEREAVLGPQCLRGLRWLCRHPSCWAAGLWRVRLDAEALLATTLGQARLLELSDFGSRPWGPGLAADIRDAVEEGWRAVDRPPDTVVVGRCACGAGLYAAVGAVRVRCRVCGTDSDVEDARAAGLAESRELLPAADLARVLGVPDGTVRSWASRGALVRVRYDAAGRPLYRVKDGAALAARGEQEESA